MKGEDQNIDTFEISLIKKLLVKLKAAKCPYTLNKFPSNARAVIKKEIDRIAEMYNILDPSSNNFKVLKDDDYFAPSNFETNKDGCREFKVIKDKTFRKYVLPGIKILKAETEEKIEEAKLKIISADGKSWIAYSIFALYLGYLGWKGYKSEVKIGQTLLELGLLNQEKLNEIQNNEHLENYQSQNLDVGNLEEESRNSDKNIKEITDVTSGDIAKIIEESNKKSVVINDLREEVNLLKEVLKNYNNHILKTIKPE